MGSMHIMYAQTCMSENWKKVQANELQNDKLQGEQMINKQCVKELQTQNEMLVRQRKAAQRSAKQLHS